MNENFKNKILSKASFNQESDFNYSAVTLPDLKILKPGSFEVLMKTPIE
jgi:hypothetical protein